jgi:hypothetical protein
MEQLFLSILIGLSMASCGSKKNNSVGFTILPKPAPVNTCRQIDEIPLPAGFERKAINSGTFTAYLRKIELKEQTTVYLYNGQPKINQTAQYAVLNISVGNKDLQQCADAVMRLRAEYQFAQQQFENIVFFDNNNTAYHFWQPFTRDNFDKYLDRVFGMCGSASLAKQLNQVKKFTAIESGDVLVRGGFPGHAVIVMDIAKNEACKKIYLLAQSYMPAQDIHVLKNPINNELSPWYEVNDDEIIQTPEYTFMQTELKRW